MEPFGKPVFIAICAWIASLLLVVVAMSLFVISGDRSSFPADCLPPGWKPVQNDGSWPWLLKGAQAGVALGDGKLELDHVCFVKETSSATTKQQTQL